MDSPLDCIEGTFESAVFTTYSLNLRFLEHWLLPRLHAVGARRIVIFADESQLGAALEGRDGRSAGRSYHLVSTRIGPGAFHPKLILLHGKEGTRLCVSSANLTVDGQLRNVEAAIALDSREPRHRAAIADAADFLRTLGVDHAPPHTLDALIGALPEAHAEPAAEGGLRFVHNLERPLIEAFPATGSLTAVTAYADGGAAAGALAARGQLEVLIDGDAFAAPAGFFTGNWGVTALSFERRHLHGKAYWTDRWLLIGSPNLSQAALLQRAGEANTEAAIILEEDVNAFPPPPGEPWIAAREIAEVAVERRRSEQLLKSEQARIGSFDAWEETEAIAVRGIAEGPIEYWDADVQAWLAFGEVQGGLVADVNAIHPQLIRRVEADGRIRQAIVHHPALLRYQATRGGVASPGADAVRRPPLTISGVHALEAVLRDLYALSSLEDEPRPSGEQHRAPVDVEPLREWRPAREGDDPRIPPLIQRSWRGDPDALLALIRKALRLDEPVFLDELEDESIDLDESTDEPPESPERPEPPGEVAPNVEERVLKRYRGALVKLLERGVSYVREIDQPVLADLAFLAVLRLHEELATTIVTVNEEEQPLVEEGELLSQKLRLLDAYLREREGRNTNCLATARIHLGVCLRARERWTPLDWETLERLAYRRGRDILAAQEFAQRAADHAHVDLGYITALVAPYAERADWAGFVVEAERILDEVECGEDPFPWVVGSDWFAATTNSPAWVLAGYAAIAGYRDQRRYGVLVQTRQPNARFGAHALFVDPLSETTYEAVRRSYGRWDVRAYRQCAERHLVRAGRMGSDAILEDVDRGSYVELTGSHPVGTLIAVAAPELAASAGP